MKILKLKVQGYRSLKDIDWELGDLNILIGPNGSGKSNLLRILEIISIASKSQLGKHIQNAGGMGALLWDNVADSIKFDVMTSSVRSEKNLKDYPLKYKMDLFRLGKGSSAYQINYESLVNYSRIGRTKEHLEPFKLLERTPQNTVFYDDNEHKLVKSVIDENVDESLLGDESFLSLFPLLTPKPNISPFGAYLKGWSIYHDLHVNSDASIRQPTITRFEKRVASDGQNLISVLHTLYTSDREFKDDINLAMSAAFGEDFDELIFPPASDQRTQLRVRWKTLKREQSVADLSDGTLRFLFLLTVLASPDPAPLIAIDEPETGLHPSMLPIVAEYAIDAAKRTQVILTTHSPQFLDAFKDSSPKITVTKWSEGQTFLRSPDEKMLAKWLKEYSLGSLYRSGELEDILVSDIPKTGLT